MSELERLESAVSEINRSVSSVEGVLRNVLDRLIALETKHDLQQASNDRLAEQRNARIESLHEEIEQTKSSIAKIDLKLAGFTGVAGAASYVAHYLQGVLQ